MPTNVVGEDLKITIKISEEDKGGETEIPKTEDKEKEQKDDDKSGEEDQEKEEVSSIHTLESVAQEFFTKAILITIVILVVLLCVTGLSIYAIAKCS